MKQRFIIILLVNVIQLRKEKRRILETYETQNHKFKICIKMDELIFCVHNPIQIFLFTHFICSCFVCLSRVYFEKDFMIYVVFTYIIIHSLIMIQNRTQRGVATKPISGE